MKGTVLPTISRLDRDLFRKIWSPFEYPTIVDEKEVKQGVSSKIENGKIIGLEIRKEFTSLQKDINLQNIKLSKLWNIELNKIQSIICELTSLRELSIIYCDLKELPEEIIKLQHLRYLDISGNKIIKLPESIGTLEKLEELDFTHNKLTSLPENLGKLKELKVLRLDLKNVTTFPPCILKLTNLEHLSIDFGYNKVASIPDEISYLTKLKSLSLINAKLSGLPNSVGELRELELLNLYNNNLTSLPDTIFQLTELRRIDVRENYRLTNLPKDYWNNVINLKHLEVLSLATSNLKSIPENLTKLQNLRVLDLYRSNLKKLPDNIGDMTSLRILNLSDNNLADLPQSITQLKNLKELYLSDNFLKPFFKNIIDWLFDLDSRGCIIEGVSLMKYNVLPKLPSVERQCLYEIEEQIGLLEFIEEEEYYGESRYFRVKDNHITELYIETDSLTVIPENIGELRELRILYLKSSQVNSLPDSLTQLTKLESFSVGGSLWRPYKEELRSLSKTVSEWILDLEQSGCKIYGLSTARIEALKAIPVDERQIIKKLELSIGLFSLMEDLIEEYPDQGDTYPSFFQVKNKHVTVIRIRVDEDYNIICQELEENFEEIDQLKHLEEITISGCNHLWNKLKSIIQTKFPRRFIIETNTFYNTFEIKELCFFSENVKNQSTSKYSSADVFAEERIKAVKDYYRIIKDTKILPRISFEQDEHTVITRIIQTFIDTFETSYKSFGEWLYVAQKAKEMKKVSLSYGCYGQYWDNYYFPHLIIHNAKKTISIAIKSSPPYEWFAKDKSYKKVSLSDFETLNENYIYNFEDKKVFYSKEDLNKVLKMLNTFKRDQKITYEIWSRCNLPLVVKLIEIDLIFMLGVIDTSEYEYYPINLTRTKKKQLPNAVTLLSLFPLDYIKYLFWNIKSSLTPYRNKYTTQQEIKENILSDRVYKQMFFLTLEILMECDYLPFCYPGGEIESLQGNIITFLSELAEINNRKDEAERLIEIIKTSPKNEKNHPEQKEIQNALDDINGILNTIINGPQEVEYNFDRMQVIAYIREFPKNDENIQRNILEKWATERNVTIVKYFVDKSEEGWNIPTQIGSGPLKSLTDKVEYDKAGKELVDFYDILQKCDGMVVTSLKAFERSNKIHVKNFLMQITIPEYFFLESRYFSKKVAVIDMNRLFEPGDSIELFDRLELYENQKNEK